jgi:argininosuccinate lyase
MVADMTVNGEAMNAAASVGFSTATDLADWLVAKAGLPFRQAHHIAGQAVALAERKGAKTLAELSLQDLQQIHPAIRADVFEVMSTQSSVNSRTSFGGTATGEVRKQIAHWRSRLEKKE